MGNLTTFLYNLLKEKTKKEDSNVWLPKVLKPYCPVTREEAVTIDPAVLGDEISNSLVDVYKTMVDRATGYDTSMHREIFKNVKFSKAMTGNEGDTGLDVSKIYLYGVENIMMGNLNSVNRFDPLCAYTLEFPVSGPAYNAKEKQLDEFSAEFDFAIKQKVCAYIAAEYEKGNYVEAEQYHAEQYIPGAWPECEMELGGHLKITLKDASKPSINLTAKITYWLEPTVKGRILGTRVESIGIDTHSLVTNSAIEPSNVTANYPGYEDLFEGFVSYFVGNHRIVDAVLTRVFGILNNVSMRENMAGRLAGYTANTFDQVLGRVDGMLPTTTTYQEENAVDQYIFDRIRYALCNKDSAYYLPKVIEACKTPDFDLTDLYYDRIDLGKLGGDGGLVIDDAVLTKVHIKGLQNLVVELGDIDFVPPSEEHRELATMKAKLSLDIFGGIELSMAGEKPDGTFTVDASGLPFYLACEISGSDVEDFSLRVNTAEMSYAENAFHIALDIPGHLTGLLESILNNPAVQPKILGAFSAKLGEIRDAISDRATAKIKQILANYNV